MANANWSNPQLTSTYTNFVSEVKNRDEDLALQFDGTTSTNIPTNTIRWDSTANRWKKWSGTAWGELTSTYALTGLSTTGNATVGGTLGVTGAITGSSTITGTALIPSGSSAPTNGIYLPSANNVAIATAGSGRVFVSSTGLVGINQASPGSALDVAGEIRIYPTSGTGVLRFGSGGAEKGKVSVDASSNYIIETAGGERLRIDSSGNVGIGVTPSATLAPYKSIELFGSFWMSGNGTTPATYLMTNAYYDGLNKYKTTGFAATYYSQVNGSHQWFTAPSGTAGAAISFTQAMTLDASGRLGLGTTGPQTLLAAFGTVSAGNEYDGIAFFENSLNNVDTNPTTAYPVLKLTRAGKSGVSYRSSAQFGIARYEAVGTAARTRLDINLGNGDVASPDVNVMSLLSSGRVGIGTTSPSQPLHVVSSVQQALFEGSTQGAIVIQKVGTSGIGLYSDAAGSLTFYDYNATTNRIKLDSSGRLLVGQTGTGLQASRSMAWQGSGEGTLYLNHSTSDGNGDPFIRFGYNAGQVGSIIQAGLTGIGLFSAGYLSLGSNNTESLRITSTGALSPGSTGTNTGSTGQSLISQGSSAAPTWGSSIVSGTAVASTSGTSIDFTGIPSWVKRITVLFSGVSTSGSSTIILQLGTSSGFETTGYASTAWDGSNLQTTTGMALSGSVASGNVRSGSFAISSMNSSNIWVGSGIIIRTDSATGNYSAGTKTLGGTLDRIRITMVNGTDTFDAGTINIMYE